MNSTCPACELEQSPNTSHVRCALALARAQARGTAFSWCDAHRAILDGRIVPPFVTYLLARARAEEREEERRARRFFGTAYAAARKANTLKARR